MSLQVRPIDYGLRDYGTAEWIGGDENCNHNPQRPDGGERADRSLPLGRGGMYKDVCKCGAKRLDAQLGLEPTLQEYIDNTVLWTREVWRVLRDDGVFFLNLGDSYAGSGGPGSQYDNKATTKGAEFKKYRNPNRNPIGFKPKDKMSIPHRVAIALQSDGWYFRAENIWAKKSWMPESVKGWRWEQHRVKVVKGEERTQKYSHFQNHSGEAIKGKAEFVDCPGCSKCNSNDGLILKKGAGRTTRSHEYIFMFSKSEIYFYDHVAVQELSAYDGRKDTMFKGSDKFKDGYVPSQPEQTVHARGHERWPNQDSQGRKTRNRRSVWLDISPSNFKGPHFAAFPPKLPEICIKAGTSEKGVCPVCGRQWARIVESVGGKKYTEVGMPQGINRSKMSWGDSHPTKNPARWLPTRNTLGWKPTCSHDEEPIPATVCDIFVGSGTALMVARQLGRTGIGIDLSWEYLQLARERTGEKAWKEWVEGKDTHVEANLEELPLFNVQK